MRAGMRQEAGQSYYVTEEPEETPDREAEGIPWFHFIPLHFVILSEPTIIDSRSTSWR